MADPLSITAFGLTICGGLVKALATWKIFSKDVSHISELVQGVYRILLVLDRCLQDQDLLDACSLLVRERVMACHDGFKDLETALTKLEGAHRSSELKREAWKNFQHAIYPLKKGGLGDLQKIVKDLQDQLSLALQIHELHVFLMLENNYCG